MTVAKTSNGIALSDPGRQSPQYRHLKLHDRVAFTMRPMLVGDGEFIYTTSSSPSMVGSRRDGAAASDGRWLDRWLIRSANPQQFCWYPGAYASAVRRPCGHQPRQTS